MDEMKNELEESWNKHKEKGHQLTGLYRDRCNFQAGFNAAFKLFGKSKVSKPHNQEYWRWFAEVSQPKESPK